MFVMVDKIPYSSATRKFIYNIYNLPVKRLLHYDILQKCCNQNRIIWYDKGSLTGKSYMRINNKNIIYSASGKLPEALFLLKFIKYKT